MKNNVLARPAPPSARRMRVLVAVAAAVVTPLLAPVPARAQTPAATDVNAAPPVRREFRGVWVATVANIDWPSRPGLGADAQKAELVHLLDAARRLNMNAIVLQVRPACDALYPSAIEPWSAYLSGRQGKAPEPLYDPLAFAVDEAHKRGLELHAWFNPYRARQGGNGDALAPNHISKTRPDLVRTYGKSLWLDPGEPEVQDYTTSVIVDVVKRYDIDGVHIDDYFYPYKEKGADGKDLPFPDTVSYNKYKMGGGTLALNDWRRSNVDTLVKRLNEEIHRAKPWVRFGISPFGIWRPGNPAQIKGFDAYDELYADSEKWLREGWGDYFAPQLYWKIEQTAQSYPALLSWWASHNPKARHLWPGNYTSRAVTAGGGANPWPAEEVEYQIRATRGQAGATGNIHFSAQALLTDPAAPLPTRLSETVYAEPALVPATPWLTGPDGATAPPLPAPSGLSAQEMTQPNVSGGGTANTLTWRAGDTRAVWLWVAQFKPTGASSWTTLVVPGSETSATFPAPVPTSAARLPGQARVYAVDRLGRAGETATFIASPAPLKKP